MANTIHSQACVDSRAELGDDIEIGPFCVVGPHVKLGNGCKLSNNVTLIGHTTIGERNRFSPNCVIGGEPQDYSYKESPTWVDIGDDNIFREGVTVNRGAEKEDHGTRIGHRNLLMSNAHVAQQRHVGQRRVAGRSCACSRSSDHFGQHGRASLHVSRNDGLRQRWLPSRHRLAAVYAGCR